MKELFMLLDYIVCMIISVFGVIIIIGQLGEIKRNIKAIEDKLYDIEKWLTDKDDDYEPQEGANE